MIKIARSPAAPASLAVEKAKGTNNYRGEDVIRQLYTDFHGKCYLCEIDNLQSIISKSGTNQWACKSSSIRYIAFCTDDCAAYYRMF